MCHYPTKKRVFIVCVLFLSALSAVNAGENMSSPAPAINTFSTNPDNIGAIANSVNLFTGDVNLPINLVSLSGKNGLDVNVSILYSSNIQQQVGVRNLEAPTSVMGLGWSMDYPKIIVDHKNTGSYYDDDYYLVSNGSSNLLVRSSGTETVREYKTKNYQFWKITYYSESLKWIIIDENGIKSEYGDKNSNRNTIQWGIKWGTNWIGESKQATNQKRYPLVWNLSQIMDNWNNCIQYHYSVINRTVGLGTLEHTEACYLSKITDSYNREIEFFYSNKTSYEYQDPHTESNEPDAYQERYETKYLNEICVYNQYEEILLSIELNYEVFLNQNTDSTKRLLTSITQYDPADQSAPSMQFSYFTSGMYKGMLNKVTLPTGGSAEYVYTKKTIEKSDRNLTITAPSGYCEPRIWTMNDYVVVTWYNPDGNYIQVRAYTWDGRWIDSGVLTTIVAPKVGDYQNFEIIAEDNFFALGEPFYQNSILNTIYIFRKKESEIGKWGVYSEYILIGHLLGDAQYRLISGSNFIAVIDIEAGRLYKYIWDGYWWNTSHTGIRDNYTDEDFWGTGKSNITSNLENYFIFHDQNKNNTDIVKLFYLNEEDYWDSTTLTCSVPSTNNGKNEPTYWYYGNQYVLAMIYGEDDKIYSWDSTFSNVVLDYSFSNIYHSNPVYIYGASINLYDKDGDHYMMRYNGNNWLHKCTFALNTIGWLKDEPKYSFAPYYDILDLAYPQYNYYGGLTGYAVLHYQHNPNNENLESEWIFNQSSYQYFVANGGNNRYVYRDDENIRMYRRLTDGGWSYENITNATDISKILAGCNYFLWQGAIPSSGAPDTKIGLIKNNRYYASSVQTLSDQAIWDRNQLDDEQPSQNYSGYIFVTFNDRDIENSDIIRLYKVVDLNYTGDQTDYPVSRLIFNTGSQKDTTNFIYDSTTATYDPSGTIAQYNKVTSKKGSGNNGYTEIYFFNNLPYNEVSLPYPANDSYTNARDNYCLLKGMPYCTRVYNGNGTPNLISEDLKYYYTFSLQLGNKDRGTYSRIRKETSTLDGITSTVEKVLSLQNGRDSLITTYQSDGTVIKSSVTYAHEKYPAMQTLNMLSQVAQQTVYESSVSSSNARSSKVITYKDWGSGKWTPSQTYSWLEDRGESKSLPAFNFSTPPGDNEWIKTSEIISLDNKGNITETMDANNIHSTTKWGYNSAVPIATIVNAKNDETFYDGFENGFNNWSSAPANNFEAVANSRTGIYGMKVFHADGYNSDAHITIGVLSGGTKYRASVWFKCDSGLYGRLFFGDANYVYGNPYENCKYVALAGNGGWQLIEAEVTLSKNEQMQIYVYCQSGENGDYVIYDDLRVCSSAALTTARSYDPSTLKITDQTDENEIITRFHYENSNNLLGVTDNEGIFLKSANNYYSREGNPDVYSATDPNYARSVTSTNGRISTFTNGLKTGWYEYIGTWSVEDGEYSQSNTSSSNTNAFYSYSQSGMQYYRWKLKFLSGSTMGGMHIMASAPIGDNRYNSYLIWQSSAVIVIYESINNTLSTRASFSKAASNGKTYEYEVTYNPGTGKIIIWRDGKYIGSWTDSTPLTSGYYISLRTNASHVHFDDVIVQSSPMITTTFADGLGNQIQSQTWDGDYDIINKSGHNYSINIDTSYHPQRISNASHVYKHCTPTKYELTRYFNDPLSRLKQITHPDGTHSHKAYSKSIISSINYFRTTSTDEKGVITRTYNDIAGNTCRVVNAGGTSDSTVATYVYDILGRNTGITDPRGLSISIAYDTRGQLTSKTTPDAGTVQYVFDNAGQLVFSRDANQAASGYFTVNKYDNLGRLVRASVEKDTVYTWSGTSYPSLSLHYGNDSDEIKIINYYDEDYIEDGVNYCKGSLTKTVENESGTETLYAYDKLGNITVKKIKIAGMSVYKTIYHTYDNLGRETAIEYPSGVLVSKTYNHLGQLTSIKEAD